MAITKIFNNAVNFLFDALLKCRKCLDIQKLDNLFISIKPWILNEVYSHYGNKIKYLSTLSINDIKNLTNKLNILSNKLKTIQIESTTIKLNFKINYDSFETCYKCFYCYTGGYNNYNITISDELKTTGFIIQYSV